MPRERVNTAKYTPEIAERFRKTRKQAKLTIRETSDKMGFNISYIKAVEYGNLSPNIDFLIKWHNTFDKSYSWILEGKY